MTAPALVLLAHGSSLPVVSEVIRAMRAHMQSRHASIGVHIAFVDHEQPTFGRVAARLTRTGVTEAVIVPLNLANLFTTSERLEHVVAQAEQQFPQLAVRVARPVGPEACLLNLVDLRLREALSRNRATELDGLVLATETAHDPRSHALLSRRARQWSLHHKLPALVATENIGSAVVQFQSEGRRHVAVGSLFLTQYETYEQRRIEALRAGAVAVGDPIGFAPEVCEVVFGRYAVAAMSLVDFGLDAEAEKEPTEPQRPHLHVVSA